MHQTKTDSAVLFESNISSPTVWSFTGKSLTHETKRIAIGTVHKWSQLGDFGGDGVCVWVCVCAVKSRHRWIWKKGGGGQKLISAMVL